MNDLPADPKRLTELPAPSGREGTVAGAVRKSWGCHGEFREDGLGDLGVTVGEGEPHVASAAHMDEAEFVIRRIGRAFSQAEADTSRRITPASGSRS